MKSYYEILINKQPLEEKIIVAENNFVAESKANGEIIINKVNGQDSVMTGTAFRTRVNLKHTIKSGYVPEFTVEAWNTDLPEFMTKLKALGAELKKQYPDMPEIEKANESTGYELTPEDAGI